ncbi:unnamed protein product [Discosporangium mesarthrocarpum]
MLPKGALSVAILASAASLPSVVEGWTFKGRPLSKCSRQHGQYHTNCNLLAVSKTHDSATWVMSSSDPSVSTNEIDLFNSWLSKNGVKVDSQRVQVQRSPLGGGRGLVATQDIEKGSTAVQIPQSLGLSPSGAKNSGVATYLKEFEGWTGDTGLIALQLLWERSLGDRSKMQPWINVLPAPGELDIPLFWDEDALALADASSTRGISGFGEDVDEDYAWLQVNAFGPNPDVFPAGDFTPELFRWAVGVALSRSFFIDGELRMVPLVDFANHSPRSRREPEGASMGLFGGRSVVLSAERDYQKGEEFFISYGPKGAAGYLEENGFVPPISGSEVISELEFSIPEDDQFFADKEDILSSNGLGTSMTFEASMVGLPDQEMVQFLRLRQLGVMDAFLLEGVFRGEVWGFMALPVSKANEESVNELIMDRCRSELSRFKGTAEEDEAIIEGGSMAELGSVEVLCARVRRGERLALQV